MSRTVFALSMVVLFGATLAMSSGCGTSQVGGTPGGSSAANSAAHDRPPDSVDEQPEPVSEAEIQQALAALSTEDRALAAKQRVCPVTEEPLGSMGTPVKVRVLGRDVLLCCAGCEDEVRAKAEEYLAKLPK